MAKAGKRYPLLLYTRMLDRWWPAVFLLGLALLGLAWALHFRQAEAWRWLTMANLGVFVILISILMFAFRKSAYVQPCSTYLRLVTPFLRMNISYKRLRRPTPTSMFALFPPNSISNWKQEILEPLVKKTTIVVELNGYPISQTVLRFFLSPFFFKDQTPHFVILVEDWMHFSSELDSLRLSGDLPAQQRLKDQSILSRLPHK